jgi:hypothetical protein
MSINRSTKAIVGLVMAGLVVLVLAANAHLVYVAVTTQPDCVAHLKLADAGHSGSYRAAKSACSPGAKS